MTREEAIDIINCLAWHTRPNEEDVEQAIKALEQEQRKDEVILTNKEYRELLSSEFVNGYAKGFREALDQNAILDKIRAEIDGIEISGQIDEHTLFIRLGNEVKNIALNIIDKYKAESEE